MKALGNGKLKTKIVPKSSLNFNFGQGSCLKSDFARPNSNKAVLVQVFLRLEIAIFNNNFVFCLMVWFCSMAQVAGWIFTREIIKGTNMFYPECFKRFWKKLDKHLWWGLFCESWMIIHYSLLKMNQSTC